MNAVQLKCFNALKNIIGHITYIALPGLQFAVICRDRCIELWHWSSIVSIARRRGEPKNIRYISFVARSLQPSERNIFATQKELLGNCFCTKKVALLLVGQAFHALHGSSSSDLYAYTEGDELDAYRMAGNNSGLYIQGGL